MARSRTVAAVESEPEAEVTPAVEESVPGNTRARSARPTTERAVEDGEVDDREVRPTYKRIVEHVLRVPDPDKTYFRLEKALRLGEARNEPGVQVKALDLAELHWHDAHGLLCDAKLERDRWELENAQRVAVMRRQATQVLEKEKKDGERTKQITDADVESTMQVIYGDEFASIKRTSRQLEMAIRRLENFVDVHQSRCRSLQVLVGRQR